MTGFYDSLRELPWELRNAEIEAALRAYLTQAHSHCAFDTFELALILDPKGSPEDVGKLSKIMARMAPHMGSLATHDGEEIRRYGKTWRRWRWRGQRF